jgi:hypothetical protein
MESKPKYTLKSGTSSFAALAGEKIKDWHWTYSNGRSCLVLEIANYPPIVLCSDNNQIEYADEITAIGALLAIGLDTTKKYLDKVKPEPTPEQKALQHLQAAAAELGYDLVKR